MIISYRNVCPGGKELSPDNMLGIDKKILILLFEQLKEKNSDDKSYNKDGDI